MPTKWSEAAALRREQIESGKDLTFSRVFVPYYRRLAESLKPTRVLDVGCGTGHLALELQSHSSTIVAIEPSPDMYAVAAVVLQGSRVNLRHGPLEDLSDQPFDLALAHLVVQMVPDLTAFFAAMRRVLRHSGRCVFSLPHPCFWNNYRAYIPRDRFKYMQADYAEATLMITKDPGHAITGVPYYHRPVQDYVKALAGAGLWVLDMDEIYPDPMVEAQYGRPWNEPRYVVLTSEARVN